MNTRFLTVLLICLTGLLSSCARQQLADISQDAATVQLDADSNGATDVSKGGTNSTTAAGALANLGAQPVLSEGAFEDGDKTKLDGLGSAATRSAEDTMTDGNNLPDGAAIKAYGDANWSGGADEIVYISDCSAIDNGVCIEPDGTFYFWNGSTVDSVVVTSGGVSVSVPGDAILTWADPSEDNWVQWDTSAGEWVGYTTAELAALMFAEADDLTSTGAIASGAVDYSHLSADALRPPIITGDPDTLDDTLATNGAHLFDGGLIRYNAPGEATIDAFTATGQSVVVEFYPSVAIIMNPNASQTITRNGVALAAGEALINTSQAGACVLTYLGSNSINAMCTSTITEETP